MTRCPSILAFALAVALSAPSGAAEVFSSGLVPDLSDPASFAYGDDSIIGFPTPPSDAAYYLLELEEGAVPAPVTVASIEFYGYTLLSEDEFLIDLFGEPDPNHGFEIGLGAGINILNVVRTDVGPALPAPLGYTATPIQRIQIDFEPIPFDGGSVVLRGDTGFAEDFYLAHADPAIAETTLLAYSDSNLTVIDTTTSGVAFQFTLFDEFQTLLEGDADGDGDVDGDDLIAVQTNFLATGQAPLLGDADFDGDVDGDDLIAVQTNFLATAASVPEPATWLLMVVGLGVARRR